MDTIQTKCFNAIRAFNAGHQGPKQGICAVGAPGVYRVLLLGPRGSGRSSQAVALAKHFGLVFCKYIPIGACGSDCFCFIRWITPEPITDLWGRNQIIIILLTTVHFDGIYKEYAAKDNEIGERIRKYGSNIILRGDIIRDRLLKKVSFETAHYNFTRWLVIAIGNNFVVGFRLSGTNKLFKSKVFRCSKKTKRFLPMIAMLILTRTVLTMAGWWLDIQQTETISKYSIQCQLLRIGKCCLLIFNKMHC